MKSFNSFNVILILLIVVALSGNVQAQAQERVVNSNNQYWIGYMTSTALSEKYSWWNDFHLVPEGFGVVRTGLTRHFKNTSMTGGYAYLWLPPGSGNTKLERHEQRPWAQVQFNTPISGPYSLTQRIRYDARFREKVNKGEVEDGYVFNHRVRFMFNVRRTLGNRPGRALVPYVAIADEVLVNFGKAVTYNTFDQNRASIFFGVQAKNTQYQVGYMNRFVQTGPTKYTSNDTFVLWITQKFDMKHVFKRHKEMPEAGHE